MTGDQAPFLHFLQQAAECPESIVGVCRGSTDFRRQSIIGHDPVESLPGMALLSALTEQ